MTREEVLDAMDNRDKVYFDCYGKVSHDVIVAVTMTRTGTLCFLYDWTGMKIPMYGHEEHNFRCDIPLSARDLFKTPLECYNAITVEREGWDEFVKDYPQEAPDERKE